MKPRITRLKRRSILAAEVLQGKTVVVVDVSCANDLLLSGSILESQSQAG
jgi:hypothetical protein